MSFYTIPDRLELYHEGKIIFEVGPTSGRSTQKISQIPNGVAYVGVKLIGNEDTGTKWWYTISCEGAVTPSLQEAREIARQLQVNYAGWENSIDACPCFLRDMKGLARKEDPRFKEATYYGTDDYHPGAVVEYRSTAIAVDPYPSPTDPGAPVLMPGQQCTYDARGNLVTEGPGAGTPDAYSPSVTWPLQGSDVGRVFFWDKLSYILGCPTL